MSALQSLCVLIIRQYFRNELPWATDEYTRKKIINDHNNDLVSVKNTEPVFWRDKSY